MPEPVPVVLDVAAVVDDPTRAPVPTPTDAGNASISTNASLFVVPVLVVPEVRQLGNAALEADRSP